MRSYVVGLDNGGTQNNATVLDDTGHFLVDRMMETPSRVGEGPAVAIRALQESFDNVLAAVGVDRAAVRAVGLDTPGPASADGVIAARGATNFSEQPWRGFDIRSALEEHLGLPVVYNNDGNAAGLYAHDSYLGDAAVRCSSVAAIVGTGLGGGIVVNGAVLKGAAGMAGELGHVHIPMDGLLEAGQPIPRCNCGFSGDVESIASLRGIENNLLGYWLSRYPNHPLHSVAARSDAARIVRTLGEEGDEMARRIFSQQAMALGRLFTILSNVLDPDVYFVGGGVVETSAEFSSWFLGLVAGNTTLREEQLDLAKFALVPDLDMAGARGAAFAANAAVSA